MANDFQRVTEALLDHARDCVRRDGAVVPAGAAIDRNGGLVRVAIRPELLGQPVAALRDDLLRSLREGVALRGFSVVAWVADVRVASPRGVVSDALVVQRERAELAELVVEHYRRGFFRGYVAGETWSRASAPGVFPDRFLRGRRVMVEARDGWQFFARQDTAAPDAFQHSASGDLVQVSFSTAATPFIADPPTIAEKAAAFGPAERWGEACTTSHGASAWGVFGRATFKPTPPLPTKPPISECAVWYVTHTTSMAMVTWFGSDEQRLPEAHALVMSLRPVGA